MKIEIICPHCNEVLTDKFSAEGCKVLSHGSYKLEMECCECERYIDVFLQTRVTMDAGRE